MPAKRKSTSPKDSSANLGFQAAGYCGQAEAIGCDTLFISLSASTAERAGVRCRSGGRLLGNANFAWPREWSGFIHSIRPSPLDVRRLGEGGHLAPQGMAGFVLANGPAVARSSNHSGEGEIRQKLIEADLVDCMVALPGQAQQTII